MWIKICGITTVEDALACAEAGADAIGFVFAASKRRISIEAAADIIAAIPPVFEKVGVFVDEPWQKVAAIEQRLGLDLLQFHGIESPAYCSRFPGKAIKAFRLNSARDLQIVESYQGKIRACLFDSFKSGQIGGTGRSWDWRLVNSKHRLSFWGIQVIVAGGLTPENVVTALQELKPDGIDTSSGVEREGRKDPGLIKKFVKTARRWEYESLA
jgi:phosphoribosylanthranilate isomerase